jgi:hypothetical protein
LGAVRIWWEVLHGSRFDRPARVAQFVTVT